MMTTGTVDGQEGTWLPQVSTRLGQQYSKGTPAIQSERSSVQPNSSLLMGNLCWRDPEGLSIPKGISLTACTCTRSCTCGFTFYIAHVTAWHKRIFQEGKVVKMTTHQTKNYKVAEIFRWEWDLNYMHQEGDSYITREGSSVQSMAELNVILHVQRRFSSEEKIMLRSNILCSQGKGYHDILQCAL